MVLLVLKTLVVGRILGIGELLDRRVSEHPVEEVRERARRIRGVDGLCVDVVLGAFAEPDGNRVLRRDAAEPTVLLVLGRAGLTRSLLPVGQARRRARTARHNALHDLNGCMSHLGRDDALAGRVGVVDDDVAFSIEDLLDALGLVVRTAVGERRIRLRHLERRHRGDAERQTGNSRQIGVDAKTSRHIDDAVYANRENQTRERRVRRDGERLRDGAHTVIVMPEVRHVRRTRHLHGRTRIDDGLRIDALLDSRGEREGLERRAGLTSAGSLARRHVALSVVVVGVITADHRLNMPVVGVDRNQRDLELLPRLVDLVLSSDFSSLLGRRVDGRVDGQTTLPDIRGRVLVAAFGVGQLVAHIAGEIRVFENARRQRLGGVEHDRLRLRRIRLLLSYHVVRNHAIKDEVATVEAVLLIVDGIVVRGRLRNADERRRLHKRQIARVLGEVPLGRRLDAIRSRAVVDGVEVHEQNLVFAVLLLELKGDVHLANLALKRDIGHLVGEDGVANELLRDGGRPLELAAEEVVHHGTRDAHEVDTAVIVETLVFRGDRSLQNKLAHLVVLDGGAILELKLRKHRGSIRGVHGRRLRDVELIHVRVIGKVLKPRLAQGENAGRTRYEHRRDDGENGQDYRLLVLLPYAVTALHCT